MQSELTRGGRKMEAAVARFPIAKKIVGANAIDVGASTGGFVQVLLANGASHVTAVDVGHGQLAPELARDTRVTNLERTDFKILSLNVAPGPFDFFSVDVSFVAARNMLRGLAFRLRPGAEGVVLVKPQFELPDHLVKGGKVDAPELRRRALESFRGKAERLGFVLVEAIDSPVAGGSGTVEILAHLRFVGRPDSLPRPGQRKATPASTKKSAAADQRAWFAVASPGLETPLARELASIAGVENPQAVEGGVEFSGSLVGGMAANLWSRIATRVVLRMGQAKARDFAPLRRALAKLRWQDVIPVDRPLRIDVSTSHCRLYHTGALAETLELAIGDRVGKLPVREKKTDADANSDDDDCTRVLVRGHDDCFTASVDASGALLHRRGWRVEAGRAPLRETLAAGMLALAGYDPTQPLVDPMCGSGTIAIEAAALARGHAPGLGRGFAFERWPICDSASWQRLRDGARESSGRLVAALIASDRDARAIAIAQRNAERAGLADAVSFVQASFGKGEVPDQPGLVILNPPYGHRLGDRGQALRMGRGIGEVLGKRHQGWRAAVLCPNDAFVAAVAAGARRKPNQTYALRNGGLRVILALWSL